MNSAPSKTPLPAIPKALSVSQTLLWFSAGVAGMFLIVSAIFAIKYSLQGELPLMSTSRRVLVTESLPLPIRGNQTKNFDFAKLRQSGESDSLQHQSVTVQMASNPSWYAVMALPMARAHSATDHSAPRRPGHFTGYSAARVVSDPPCDGRTIPPVTRFRPACLLW